MCTTNLTRWRHHGAQSYLGLREIQGLAQELRELLSRLLLWVLTQFNATSLFANEDTESNFPSS